MFYIIPHLISHVEDILSNENGKKIYFYENFPILDPKLFIKISQPIIKYHSRFEVYKDEVYNFFLNSGVTIFKI